MENMKPLILYDGVCNLCNASVAFVVKRDKQKVFRFASLQSDLASDFRKKNNLKLSPETVILVNDKKIFSESNAILEICRQLPAPWNWLVVFGFIPQKRRNTVYRWIAKNRYRWFGKKTIC